MANNIETLSSEHEMDLLEQKYEEDSGWIERRGKKKTKVISTYQSFQDDDISQQALQTEENKNIRENSNDQDNSKIKGSTNTECNDELELPVNKNSENNDLEQNESRENNWEDNNKENNNSNNIKSTLEVEFRKHVELNPLTKRSERISSVVTMEVSAIEDAMKADDVSVELENDPTTFIETDNRVAVKRVDTVVIETDFAENKADDVSVELEHDPTTFIETDNRVAVKRVDTVVIETDFAENNVGSNVNSYYNQASIVEAKIIGKTEVVENELISTNQSRIEEVVTCSWENKSQSSVETDNRVSIKEVETAVIETAPIIDGEITLSSDMSDVGPEIRQKTVDIDTLKADLHDASVDNAHDDNFVDNNDPEDSGDYKVVGNDTESLEFKQLVHAIETGSIVSLDSLVCTDESAREKNVERREDAINENKTIDNARGVNNSRGEHTSSDHFNLMDTNKQVNDKGTLVKRRRHETLDVIVENGETGHEDEGTKAEDGIGHDETNSGIRTNESKNSTKLTGLRIDQYKITQESVKTVTTKTEMITERSNNAVDSEVAMRDFSGRDMMKVRRGLKLDIPNSNNDGKADVKSSDMSQSIGVCCRCGVGFGTHEQIVNSNGEIWHPRCFVCAQCFQPFPEGIFYEYEGRKYCEHDFHVLFAPCCGKCGEFIVGRVIKAMNNAWHPDCFRCQLCTGPLADAGFVKNAGRALCRECNAKEKARGLGKYVCHKCHSIIEEGHIKYKGEAFHPYHFNCNTCNTELNADAREVGGELYCLRCHDKMGIPICGACRRPIEERVVHALGKAWHVEHFVCAKCEKPFFGTRHYEKKGLAYCEVHYHQLFGNICFTCNSVISGDVFHAFNKAWHVNHFACSICDRKMSQKTKFFEFDLKPVCKFCYEKFPGELKKRLKKAYEEQGAKK